MKNTCITTSTVILLVFLQNGFGQSFSNLDFEGANLTGFSPGQVPVSAAFPGWTLFLDQGGVEQGILNVSYYDIPHSPNQTSIDDTNAGNGFVPFQGQYSADLYSPGANNVEASISQTGLVPIGTKSLFLDASYSLIPFVVTLGGQTINLQPVQVFSNYTLYGANISSFAGKTENLTIRDPAAFFVNGANNELILDNIQFSPQPTPEPSVLSLIGFSVSLLAWKLRSSSFAKKNGC